MGAAKQFQDDTDPRSGVHHGGPDADTVGGVEKDPQFNAQRGRDGLSAGQRGSNHVGQGSDGATAPEPHPEGVDAASHVRNGNSGQESFDEKDDQDMDMKLEDSAEEELDAIGGTERADYGYTPDHAQKGDSGQTKNA
jgi:hypothetical protein